MDINSNSALLEAAEFLNNTILSTFNKEGIMIFVVFSSMFFLLAAVVAKWALESGQFSDIESSKYEMLEDDEQHEGWLARQKGKVLS